MLPFLNLDAYVFEAKDSLCEEGSNLSTALCSSFTYISNSSSSRNSSKVRQTLKVFTH